MVRVTVKSLLLLSLISAASAASLPSDDVPSQSLPQFVNQAGGAALQHGVVVVHEDEQAVADNVNLPPPRGGWSFTDCGVPTDAVTVDSISVSPDPPQPGQKLTVTAKGTVHDRVSEGSYADVVVKLGLIKLLQKRFDVCEEAEKANATIQCPVEKGDYKVVQTVDLPKEIPRAKFNVHVTGKTQDDQDLLCADISITFPMHNFF